MPWIALVAVKDAQDSIAPTVAALAALRGVVEVWVVDDGSTDDTANVAAASGARVVRLETNVGKGGALAAGVAATPHAERYLLADADLGATASGLQALIDAHEHGTSSLTVGALPSAGGRGGFGTVKRFAAAGIRRACGLELLAPISGQRAIDGGALRAVKLADRFGVEVAMTIDVARNGGAVAEVPVDVDHHHTGRSLAGFRHRARQGCDIFRALVTRTTTVRQRGIAVVGAAVVSVLVLSLLSMVSAPDRGRALPVKSRVVVFAFDHLGLADLERNDLPGLTGLVADGAAGVLSVRTTDRRSLDRRAGAERPSVADAFASLGASARVRSATAITGDVVDATGIAEGAMRDVRALAREDRALSLPGSLGAALHRAGKRSAFVGAAQLVTPRHAGFPAALGIADARGRIDSVDIAPSLLESTLGRPRLRASVPAFVLATATAIRGNDVVLVDPGETARAYDAHADRTAALQRTDAILAGVRGVLPPEATLVVIAPTPPGTDWELTPLVVYSDAISAGTIASSSTRRSSLAVLTDVAPTVLSLVGLQPPTGMTGAVLRSTSGTLDAAKFARLTEDGGARSRFFLGASVGYTVAVLAFYLVLITALAAGLVDRWRRPLRLAALSAAAFPLALLITGASQHWGRGGGESPVALVATCMGLAVVAERWRGLRPLQCFAVAVVALITCDVAVTGPLHTASLLGYSLQTTGRFYGLPNASFSVFASSLLIVAGAVAGGLRPATPVRAMAGASVLGAGVVFVGAPWLGNDVGGTLALAPVAAAVAWKFSGRVLTRATAAVGGAVIGLVLVLVLLAEAALADGTHLGRAFGGGEGSVISTLTQRGENNFGLLVDQWWGFLVIVLALAGLVALGQRRGLRELPQAAPIRAVFAGGLALSLVAFAVNDSGPVVAVLCLVVVAPVLAMRAIDAYPRGQSGR